MIDSLHDNRTDCVSVLLKMPIKDYLLLAKDAHAQRGGISGQREVLKTTTAKRVRDRMVADIRAGAVLPPVVIGVIADSDLVNRCTAGSLESSELLASCKLHEITIIDGMQRTAALSEAVDIDVQVEARQMRVEFWIAQSVRPLVYRMLVLNTGQVPWTLARQLSVVYAPLLEEIRDRVPNLVRVFSPDKPGRRVASAQFSSDSLIELYLSFSLRKTNVDTKETLSEEFSRLDFVDNLADEGFQNHFYASLAALADLDIAFDKYDTNNSGRFSRGRDIFGGQPARIGFMVAVAQHVLGRPALDREPEEREKRMSAISQQLTDTVKRLDRMSQPELAEFLKLDVLSEILDKKVGQIGRYERNVYFEAFKVLIDEKFDLPNMEPCWRAS